MNLNTTYLGLPLRTPLVVSASPLSENLDQLRIMEDSGASAVVLHSLFEEQLRQDQLEMHSRSTYFNESHAEALSYFPELDTLSMGPERYLEHVARAKQSLGIPVIASLNGSTPGGWTTFAKEIQQAGADALELNLYNVPTDLNLPGHELENQYYEVFKSVRSQINIPLAVKLSPYFTNMAHVARRFDQLEANGLVLFNRFYQPDIDLETLEVTPNVFHSTPMSLRLPLRWIAILHGKIRCNLAATGGVHRGTDAIKLLMAGADVTMLCSALMRHGIPHIQVIERSMAAWLEEHEYHSVAQLKGSMSHRHSANPAAFERAQYVRAVGTHSNRG